MKDKSLGCVIYLKQTVSFSVYNSAKLLSRNKMNPKVKLQSLNRLILVQKYTQSSTCKSSTNKKLVLTRGLGECKLFYTEINLYYNHYRKLKNKICYIQNRQRRTHTKKVIEKHSTLQLKHTWMVI